MRGELLALWFYPFWMVVTLALKLTVLPDLHYGWVFAPIGVWALFIGAVLFGFLAVLLVVGFFWLIAIVLEGLSQLLNRK